MGAIIAIVVISRKEGEDATVSRPEGPLSSQGCGALAVAAAIGSAPGVALRAGEVHRVEPEHDLPAHAPQRAVHAHSSRHDRAAVWRAAGDAARAVRVREAVLAHVWCTTPSGTLSASRSATTAFRVRPRSTSTTTWLLSRAIRQRRGPRRAPPPPPRPAGGRASRGALPPPNPPHGTPPGGSGPPTPRAPPRP